MAKVRISYPALVNHTIEVELPEEAIEELLDSPQDERAKFIETQAKKELDYYEPYHAEAALDTGYATIKRIG